MNHIYYRLRLAVLINIAGEILFLLHWRPPARRPRAGSPWGPWVWAHGPMGPVPWAQALASGIYIGEVLGWVLGRILGDIGG